MSKVKVLVVDDEPGVLCLVADALSLRGYEVHAVPSSGLALDLVKTMPCFDLMVSDVIMPEMCGPELATELGVLSPTTAILMMSAHFDGRDLPGSPSFISKPFLLADLYSAVEKTLARKAAATGA